ncbi:UV-damaged DNA-binding protein rad7 [Ciborinia camelliae]|nr:UV-damaged DNA-binding protein rad7 [Ciborinia camelliae]
MKETPTVQSTRTNVLISSDDVYRPFRVMEISPIAVCGNPPPPPPPGAPNGPGAPAPRRPIRGPQSALTDFLASHNINATQIRQYANARRAAALASQTAEEVGNGDENEDESIPAAPEIATRTRSRLNESEEQKNKRKKDEEKAIAKIKASKQFQRRKAYGSDEDVSGEDEAALRFFNESMAPLPGQIENCEICEKRFTVTAYSRTGADGGLLCPQCTKELNQEEGQARKKRKTQAGAQRRKTQSNLLDGIYPGAKDLMTLCIETLAKNVDMAEDLGDLPEPLMDKLSAILSKRRLLRSNTLDLFLQNGREIITIYEGAYLTSDDYIRIFQVVPSIKSLRIRSGIQFKDKVMDHLLATTIKLEHLSLSGSNLISDNYWNRYFTEKGSYLKSFKVYHTDGQFGDDQIDMIAKKCPQLTRLKISHNQKVTDDGIAHISRISTLQHLGLEIQKTKTSAPYVQILDSIGPQLRTLSLGRVHKINDSVLNAIHDNCQNINKLRITDNSVMTDAGFANLFTNWYNPPLSFIDLSKNRHVDASVPRDNPDDIGLCSQGFEALMAHSGAALRYLDINSCRHISLESFESAFSVMKTYPELQEMNLSFCQEVNDFVVESIFRTCPKLKKLIIFGNFKVRDVRVPKGKILIGMPNAMGMQIEGSGVSAW